MLVEAVAGLTLAFAIAGDVGSISTVDMPARDAPVSVDLPVDRLTPAERAGAQLDQASA